MKITKFTVVPAQSKASYAHDVAFRYLITADQSAHYRSALLPPFARQFQISARTGIKEKKKKNASVMNIMR